MSSVCASVAMAAPISDLTVVFAKPLITGASISADYGATSPGKKLAREFNPKADIRTIAFGGRSARETLKHVGEAELKGRSIVLGVDLFFWDSTLASADQSLAAMTVLLERTERLKIPLVLGEIPELLPGRQVQRQKLNAAIRKACVISRYCYVMPFEALLFKTIRDGYVEVNGKRHGLDELVPDGLHLSPIASEYLAGVLRDVLLRKPLPI